MNQVNWFAKTDRVTPYIKDDVLVVDRSVAQEWERSGWVERVTGTTLT
jgi:hypothetical protein